METAEEQRLSQKDLLLVPEWYGAAIPAIGPGISKIILNQNAFYTFRSVPLGGDAFTYSHPDIVGTGAVSEHSIRFLRYAFPSLPIRRIHLGIDPNIYFPEDRPRRKRIAFMPRKRREDSAAVIHAARSRGALTGWEVYPIDSMSEMQVGETLRKSWIFLSMSTREGFGLPAAEAMASGCLVAGFHGYGGVEFFDPEWSFPARDGDVLDATQALTNAILTVEEHPDQAYRVSQLASRAIHQRYTLERERADILDLITSATERLAGKPGTGIVRGLTLPERSVSRWRRSAHHLKNSARALNAAARALRGD